MKTGFILINEKNKVTFFWLNYPLQVKPNLM